VLAQQRRISLGGAAVSFHYLQHQGYQILKKKSPYGLGCSENRGQRVSNLKKKTHMASGGTKTEAKRLGSMASGSIEPRQKGPLWLRFLTEAKSYALLASPQYASVPEPVQNIKNNRCQIPFLHWCTYIITS